MGQRKGENAMEEIFDVVEIFDQVALFGNFRIDHDTVPEGWFCYDLRGSDEDPGMPATLEPYVVVNHAGTILSPESIWIDKEKGFRELDGELEFLCEDTTLAEFCKDCGFEAPQVQQTDPMCPARSDEAGLFHAMTREEQEAQKAQAVQETQEAQEAEETQESKNTIRDEQNAVPIRPRSQEQRQTNRMGRKKDTKAQTRRKSQVRMRDKRAIRQTVGSF